MRIKSGIFSVIVGMLLVLWAPAALAQDPQDYVGRTPPGGPTTVSGSDDTRVGGTTVLPVTGADIVMLLIVGASLTAVGVVLVRTTRRRGAPVGG